MKTDQGIAAQVARGTREVPGADRRYIYTGDTRPTVPGYAVRANRRGVARKISTFNIILILVASGVTIVFYVHNILAVNRLAFEISQLEQKYQSIRNTNAALEAEVTKKAALDRIGAVAGEQLNMRYPVEQPVWLDVDTENLPEVPRR
jgi:cell division protein FtsL